MLTILNVSLSSKSALYPRTDSNAFSMYDRATLKRFAFEELSDERFRPTLVILMKNHFDDSSLCRKTHKIGMACRRPPPQVKNLILNRFYSVCFQVLEENVSGNQEQQDKAFVTSFKSTIFSISRFWIVGDGKDVVLLENVANSFTMEPALMENRDPSIMKHRP